MTKISFRYMYICIYLLLNILYGVTDLAYLNLEFMSIKIHPLILVVNVLSSEFIGYRLDWCVFIVQSFFWF